MRRTLALFVGGTLLVVTHPTVGGSPLLRTLDGGRSWSRMG